MVGLLQKSRIVSNIHLEKHSAESHPLPNTNNLVPQGAKLVIKQGLQQPLPAGLEKIRIEGHPFWRSKKRGSRPQQLVFERADGLKQLGTKVVQFIY